MAYTTRIINIKLDEIRSYFNLNISQLAVLLGISRQAMHRWRDGKSLPCLKIYWRIEAFHMATIRFKDANIVEPLKLLHAPVFKGRSLANLIDANQEYFPAISYLIMEQRRMLADANQLQLSLVF
jgi:DNA-binding XRE family transcriptional regulator